MTAKFLYFLVSRVHVVIKLQHYTRSTDPWSGAVLFIGKGCYSVQYDAVRSLVNTGPQGFSGGLGVP